MKLDQLVPNISIELFIAVCVLFVVYFIVSTILQRSRNFPPGPMGLPIVGYLPFLTKNPHLKLQELRRKYGKVFSLRLGSSNVVVLNDANAIKEAFNKPEFLGRPPNSAFTFIEGIESVIIMNGPEWTEHRRFALHSMRDLGLGKSRMEEHIKDEIEHFINVVKQHNGEPFNIREPLTPSMSNNICALVYGKRFEYDDPNRKLLEEALEEITNVAAQTTVYAFFPWTKWALFKPLFGYERLFKVINTAFTYVRGQIDLHKETLDPNNIRDFIDGYLLEMKNKKENGINTSFTENRMLGTVQSLFGAGSETVRTTIGWCLYTMATYPDVQKKIYQEIDDVIGKERMPMWLDQKSMPYTQSVLMEIQRWKTVIPINLFRYTLQDSTVSGYNIPKGTTILANLWAAHHDPEYWTDPEEFIPDRFLSKDRKSVVKSECYMPFSVGRRSCPGEAMAVVEAFLYFTCILQRFEIQHPKGTKPDLEGILGLSYQPKPHKLCLILRQ